MYDFAEIQSVESKLCMLTGGFHPFNHGGMNEAIFIPEEYILTTPTYNFAFDAAKSAALSGSIVLKVGATGYHFRFTPDTGGFTESMQEDDNDIYFDQLFTISIPKDRPELTWLKYIMARQRYALLYRDANGTTKLLRNLRIKQDLNTSKRAEEYNGHIMYCRRSSVTPALHWQLAVSSALESIYTVSSIQMDVYFTSLTEGWQAGKKILLPETPLSLEAIYAVYNNSVILRPGTDFTIDGATVTLSFGDEAFTGSPGEIQFYYGCNKLGDGISAFSQETFTKTATYTSGETITLATAPASIDHINIRYNQTTTLRAGIDFTLSGNTVTLQFGSSPTPTDTDIFQVCYADTDAAGLSINGFKHFGHYSAGGLSTNDTITLPHTPIAGSLFVRYKDTFQLLPGTDYNTLNETVTILFDTDAKSRLEFWYAY
jgi:hypothetical protein